MTSSFRKEIIMQMVHQEFKRMECESCSRNNNNNKSEAEKELC